ncbi:hypothetical protein M0R45_001584 [Rubus argutus]|uniref:Uncharacterized protein n=1 Tax=Rubus argutus TaxID=59490 RepID=A0AAW1VLR3_RUBAR
MFSTHPALPLSIPDAVAIFTAGFPSPRTQQRCRLPSISITTITVVACFSPHRPQLNCSASPMPHCRCRPHCRCHPQPLPGRASPSLAQLWRPQSFKPRALKR